MGAALGAFVAAAVIPAEAVQELAPQSIEGVEIDWENETRRIQASIYRTLARKSPYLQLLEGGAFPMNIGSIITERSL